MSCIFEISKANCYFLNRILEQLSAFGWLCDSLYKCGCRVLAVTLYMKAVSVCVFAEDSHVHISQIKHFHISTCNEFHHSVDQFKIPQTDCSRLEKCMRTSAVKQYKDEKAASGLGYF